MVVSFNSALVLIKIFQMLDFFIFLNLDLPLNVQKFMEFFNLELFDIVPNPFEDDSIEDDCNLHHKLRENDLKCMGLNNMGQLILQIGLIAVLKLFFIFLTCFTWPKGFKAHYSLNRREKFKQKK